MALNTKAATESIMFALLYRRKNSLNCLYVKTKYSLNSVANMINRGKRKTNSHKTKRKFHIALLLVLCLCYNMSIALGNDMNEQNPSYDMTTSKIREPKEVVPPARLHDLRTLHGDEYEEDEEDEPDEYDEFIKSKSGE